MFTPPSLDTLARHVTLAISANGTITNKTRLTIDNTSAYLIQADGTMHSHTFHSFIYLMLKGDIAYTLFLGAYDQAKFLSIEQKIVKSFRFI
jgi:hypothetical protein